ncbi:MAG: hypothetical protein IPM29_24735 [Planctomycetes bacterium]|nr:hypothetical protein [Planctomycetota bacterium]
MRPRAHSRPRLAHLLTAALLCALAGSCVTNSAVIAPQPIEPPRESGGHPVDPRTIAILPFSPRSRASVPTATETMMRRDLMEALRCRRVFDVVSVEDTAALSELTLEIELATAASETSVTDNFVVDCASVFLWPVFQALGVPFGTASSELSATVYIRESAKPAEFLASVDLRANEGSLAGWYYGADLFEGQDVGWHDVPLTGQLDDAAWDDFVSQVTEWCWAVARRNYEPGGVSTAHPSRRSTPSTNR